MNWFQLRRRVPVVEQLENIYCLSAIAFVEHSLEVPEVAETLSNGSEPWDGLYAVDTDADGQHELLAFAYSQFGFAGAIATFRDTGGTGTFSNHTFSEFHGSSRDQLSMLQSLLYDFGFEGLSDGRSLLVDIDGDGDTDEITALEHGIKWRENSLFGKVGWAASHDVTQDSDHGHASISNWHDGISLDAADFDGDGDLDLVWENDWIAWYENLDGEGTFGNEQVIAKPNDRGFVVTPTGTSSISAADIDGDGDIDLVAIESDRHQGSSCESCNTQIVWYENMDGNGTFGNEQPLASVLGFAGRSSIATADVDGDGDVDIVSAVTNSTTVRAELAWFENTDGAGSFGVRKTIYSGSDQIGPMGHIAGMTLSTADLDGDGDLDLLWANGNAAWFENRVLGDSNNDGMFSAEDLIAVLSAGKYEESDKEDAKYDEGDWNQDGKFDSEDLIFALVAGHYQAV